MAVAKQSDSKLKMLCDRAKKAVRLAGGKLLVALRLCGKAVRFAFHRVLLPIYQRVYGFLKRSARAASALGAALILLVCAGAVTVFTGATVAYTVMYGGQSLGAISSTSVLAEAEILAADKLNNAACIEQLIDAELVKTVVASAELISADALADQMISHSDGIVSAAVLSVDGQEVAAESDAAPVNQALESYLSDYKTANQIQSVELCTSVSVKEVYTLKSNYEALPCVSDYLAECEAPLPVQTVDTVVETEKIAYKTVKTESSAYTVGTEIVTQQGKAGVAEVTYKVAMTDGELTQKTKLSTKVLEEPVTRKVTVGTKRVIAADKNGDAPMMWPVKRVARSYVSSYVGDGRGHKGMDIAAPAGTPIYAAEGGTVIYSGRDGSGYGNYIIIRHENGLKTLYAHCKALYVKKGDSVAAGESIAAVGNTGRSTGNHLHFEVRKNGEFLNPSNYIGSN